MNLNNAEVGKKGIKELPKCANPNCKNKGWIFLGKNIICSDCFKNWHDRQEQGLLNSIIEANK